MFGGSDVVRVSPGVDVTVEFCERQLVRGRVGSE